MRSFFGGGGAYLTVDSSELAARIAFLRETLTKSQFERLLHRTFNEVGTRSKPLINRPVTKDYAVTKKWVNDKIGKYQLSYGMAGVNCVIPLSSKKGTIGGRFAASRGEESERITASILRSKQSVLPSKMKNQGGNPPFIGKNGVAFTRRTSERLPIVRVVGLGVPQMPLNQSKDEVRKNILDLAWERLEHNYENMFSK